MLSGVELKQHNLKYHQAVAAARVWLVEQLKLRGANSKVYDRGTETSKAEGKHEAIAHIQVNVDFGRFDHEAKGLVVLVKRRKHSVTYRRKTTDWMSFPWGKITDYHLKEVDAILQREKQWVADLNKQDRLKKQAQEEVWLPTPHFVNAGMRFHRNRNENGSYAVHLDGYSFTLEEARMVRDIAIAAYNRSDSKPIEVPHEQKVKETPTGQTQQTAKAPQAHQAHPTPQAEATD